MRIEIARVEEAFGGTSFGDAGRYEKVVGRAFGRLDPAHPLNAGIVNVALAPTDADGLVSYECDLYLLRPQEQGKGNGALLFDVLNRGNKVALHSFNDAPRDAENPAAMTVNDPSSPADGGNGFLMRHGFSVLWSGWQGLGVVGGDDLMSARLPVATDGSEPIVDASREEFVFEHSQSPVAAPLSYPAARPDDQMGCTLTVRQCEGDPRTAITPAHWRFVSANAIEIDRPDGFDASAIYEFIYPARDPIVMGIGFAAVRDVVSFVRRDQAGIAVDRTIAFGMSQAGRFLRDFVHLGFNEDLAGRRVFDGLFPSMAGSRKTFTNYAFAQPGRFARQHEDRLFPHDQFPFSYATTTDPVSGKTDGLLARCHASRTCPKVIQTESSSDFFHGRASLLVTDGDGAEIPVPDAVRLYHFAGVQHGGGGATANFARNFPFTKHALNPADFPGVHRALLLALDRWIADGTPPPPSEFPTADTLVAADPAAYGFPAIPGVDYRGLVNGLSEIDYTAQPPRPIPGHDYVVVVPAIDADGNETAGIRVPEVAVPRGTYTGWAPRRAGYAEDELIALGAFLPFAQTRDARMASGDPRPSIEERYPTPDDYIRKIGEAARALFDRGLLLAEDIDRIVDDARARVKEGT
jgi:hypothetical protein